MRADSKKETLLEIVFAVLLCLSLVCFAGIPALKNTETNSLASAEK